MVGSVVERAKAMDSVENEEPMKRVCLYLDVCELFDRKDAWLREFRRRRQKWYLARAPFASGSWGTVWP
jgi:hypothetical protein